MNKNILILLLASLAGMQALAGNITVPNTFVDGTTASAGEVNANFDSIVSAVNDNDSRITANSTDIQTNGANIGVNDSRITANTADIQEYINQSLSPDDLIGMWACKAYQFSTVYVDGWVLSADGLFIELNSSTITFSNDGDNTYSLQTSAPNPFVSRNVGGIMTEYEVASNIMFYKWSLEFDPTNINIGAYATNKISDTKIVFIKIGANAGGSSNSLKLECDKLNT